MEETCLRNKIGVRERDAEIQRGWRLEWNKAVKYCKTLAEYGNSDKHANFIYILFRDDLQGTVNLFCLLSSRLDSLSQWHLCIATTVNTFSETVQRNCPRLYTTWDVLIMALSCQTPRKQETLTEGLVFRPDMRYVRCCCIHAKERLKVLL